MSVYRSVCRSNHHLLLSCFSFCFFCFRPIYQSVCLSVYHLSICHSVYNCTCYLSVCLSIYRTSLSVYSSSSSFLFLVSFLLLPVYLSVYLSICPSVCLSVYSSSSSFLFIVSFLLFPVFDLQMAQVQKHSAWQSRILSKLLGQLSGFLTSSD
jgi:hypothetical protein